MARFPLSRKRDHARAGQSCLRAWAGLSKPQGQKAAAAALDKQKRAVSAAGKREASQAAEHPWRPLSVQGGAAALSLPSLCPACREGKLRSPSPPLLTHTPKRRHWKRSPAGLPLGEPAPFTAQSRLPSLPEGAGAAAAAAWTRPRTPTR